MFNSTVLEVAIGLVFCYASVALITSSIYEALASWLGLRSKNLLTGIKSLLNANSAFGDALLLQIYNHGFVHPTGRGTAAKLSELVNTPSYIDSKNFAVALVDAVQKAPGNFTALGTDIDAIHDPQLRQLLRGMYDRAAGKVENLQAQVAAWFDAGMDRVSGHYKRQSQLWCFVIALALAMLFNIDSIHLFSTLWQHPALVAQISATTATPPVDVVHQLSTLPIGWENGFCAYTVLGWLITATAALFGAPFWFDLLQQLVRIRGTGPKPKS